MSFYSSEITDQVLEKLSDDLQRELQKVLQDAKNDSENGTDKVKQVPILNSLLINVTKLLNLRKKIKQKMDH